MGARAEETFRGIELWALEEFLADGDRYVGSLRRYLRNCLFQERICHFEAGRGGVGSSYSGLIQRVFLAGALPFRSERAASKQLVRFGRRC